VDLLWTVDVELDEIISDANATLANADQGNAVGGSGADAVTVVARVAKVKQNAEVDKVTLAGLVRSLVVCVVYVCTVVFQRDVVCRRPEF
jgi:hypothetical protein